MMKWNGRCWKNQHNTEIPLQYGPLLFRCLKKKLEDIKLTKEIYGLRVEKYIHQLFTSDEGPELRKELSEIMTIFCYVSKLKKEEAASNLDRNDIMAESLRWYYIVKSKEKKALTRVRSELFNEKGN